MRTHRTTIIRKLASEIERYRRCKNDPQFEHAAKDAHDAIQAIQKLLPSGSGIDCGTKILIDDSCEDRIVLSAEFHHMDENGYYDGWTRHIITIRPQFNGIDIRISGRNRNEIKDYLHETYSHTLTQEIDVFADGTILEAYWQERVKTRNETDRFFQIFDPIYSGM